MSKLARIWNQLSRDPWAFWIVWIGLTIINLVPVWHQRLLPMLDSPNHLALVRGWHNFHDPAFHLSDYFSLRIKLVPYIFFYSFVNVAMYVVGIETANKLFLSLYLILLPISVLALARALGRSRWLALGAFPLSFNPAWIYGYSSLLIGNCFFFFSLAALIRYLEHKRERDLLYLLVFCTLAYTSHILPWFVFGLVAIAFLVVQRRDWRYGLRAALAMLPSVVLAVVAMFEESWEHAYIHDSTPFAYQWRDVPTLFLELPGRVLEIFPGHLDSLVLFVIVATTVGLCVWRGTRVSDAPGEHRHLKILIGILALLYLCLPYQITGPLIFFQMAQRIPALAAAAALLLPAGNFVGRQRLVFLPLIIAAALLPLKMARLYRDFSHRNRGFMQLVNEIPLGSKTFVVTRGMMTVTGPVAEVSGDPASSGPVYWHFSSWPMALRGGYSPHLFDQGIPIRYVKRLKAPGWNTADSFEIRQAPDFDYYLVKNPTDSMQREPSLELVDEVGEWWLFQRVRTLSDEP